VIHTWTEMKDFKAGEILVVNNTNPAFVPYLHKAAAIIAAEGGVTVHAAIVSREMKIPCIIGVRDVTRVLETGEVVTVDATKGIIMRQP
jgi:pyruvate, water dikinase